MQIGQVKCCTLHGQESLGASILTAIGRCWKRAEEIEGRAVEAERKRFEAGERRRLFARRTRAMRVQRQDAMNGCD
jgi:hypothetical protein